MKKVIAVILYTIIIVNLVWEIVFFYDNSQSQQQNNTNQNANNTNVNSSGSIPNVPSNKKVPATELIKHNSKSDCWVSYKEKVYDLTSWLPDHPGSADAIAPYCGTSRGFETAFTGQHGTSQVEKLMQEGTYKGDLVIG